MTKVKRTKNIFSQNIENESLYQLQEQGEYKIGSLEIRSDWLSGVSYNQYIRNIYSSLKLAELRQELEKLKDEANNPIKQSDEQSSPTKTNLFKMAIIKKKINNFQVDDSGDIHKINQVAQANKNFLIAKPPPTETMLIQKLTTASIAFFQKPITRKCFLQQKVLIVESQKNKQTKEQWPRIDLETYKLEVNTKPKPTSSPKKKQTTNPFEGLFGGPATSQIKDKDDSKKMFQGFEWVEGFESRILLTKKGERSYCLYLKNEDVQKLFKYLKFHNFQKTLQKNKHHVFSEMSNQLSQKIITLFNNRLRMYDYSTKMKPNERGFERQPPSGKLLNPNELDSVPTTAKKNVKFSDTTAEKENQVEKPAENKHSTMKKKEAPVPVEDNANESVISPLERRKSSSQIHSMSNFKLRTKKATVFYDELEGDINIISKDADQSRSLKGQMLSQGTPTKDPMNSPEYKIQDFNLNMKEEGMSEIDEDSFSQRSVIHNRKRTTNISVSANVYRQMKGEVDSEEEENAGNQFNINIHEIDSDSDDHRFSSRGPYFTSHQDQVRNGFVDDSQLIRINTGSSMSSLMLEQIDQRSDLDRHYSQPKNDTPRSFHTSSSGGRQPSKMRLCLREREPNMKAMCYQVEMLYPYYKENMSFQILQVDPEIEMQKYQVICSQAEFAFAQKPNCSPKYSKFVPTDTPASVGLTRDSDQFIFILRQENHQNLCFNFRINLQHIRYQKDLSQLILIHENDKVYMNSSRSPTNKNLSSFTKKPHSFNSSIKSTSNPQTYKFAAIIKLYISPHQIQIWPQLTTVEFLKKYIVMTIYDPHYDFKHNFIQRKKINHQLKAEVNKRCVKNILKSGLHKEDDNIKEIVFNGLPDEVVDVLEKKLEKQEQISKEKIWQMINFHRELDNRQMRLLEDSITPVNMRTVKMMLKPLELLGALMNFQWYNKCLRRRIYEIGLFFLYRNPNTSIIENLVTAVCKQILLKLENILIRTKNEEEIKGIVKVYLEVEYEIDELFAEVRKYFN